MVEEDFSKIEQHLENIERALARLARAPGRAGAPLRGPTGTQPAPQWTEGVDLFIGVSAAPATDVAVRGDGYAGDLMAQFTNTGTGTYAVTPRGSLDGTTYFDLPYQIISDQSGGKPTAAAQSGPVTIAVAGSALISIGAYCEWYKFPLSAVSVNALATGKMVLVPV